jgi:hypothetical protein
MWRVFVAVFGVAVLGAGCSFFRPEPPVQKAPEPEILTEIEAPAVKAPEPRVKPEPPPKPSYDPSILIGLNEAQVIAAIGDPDTREEKAPAHIWRYSANECTVNLFFYLDLGDEEFHLLSHETNHQDGGADAAQRCYDQALGERAQ